MPKLIAVATLAMGALFCAVQIAPASAQVMKNFSWKKKPSKVKPHEAAVGRERTPLARKRHKPKSGD